MGGGNGTGGRVVPFSQSEPRKIPLKPEHLAEFNWSRETIADQHGVWLACVPELEGCFATGITIYDAMTSLDRVLKHWLETALKKGTHIPLPRIA